MGESRRRYQLRDGVARSTVAHDDKLTIATSQDVEPILDGIARDRETMRHGTNKLAARLPLVIYEDLKQRGIIDDEDAFKRWLNGPEATPFRIWQGQL